MKSWYQIRAQQEGEDSAEILIYDDIGYFGITPKDFVEDIKALGDVKNLTVRINSYGGEVFAGHAIYNFLQRHPANKTVWVDGIAASIASVIAMAGDRVIMPDNAFMMIHRSWGLVIGNAEDMDKWAETMRKFDQSIIQAYQRRSNMSVDEIEQLMSDETWLTAAEAVAGGFADEISEPVQLAARATFRVFNKLPKAIGPVPKDEGDGETTGGTETLPAETEAASTETEESETETETTETETQPTTARTEDEIRAEAQAEAQEVVRLCADAGVPDAASEFMKRNMSAADVKTRLALAPKIRDACAAARLPNRAAGYIKGTLSIGEIKEELFDAKMAADPHEIHGQHGPELRDGKQVELNPKTIVSDYKKQLQGR